MVDPQTAIDSRNGTGSPKSPKCCESGPFGAVSPFYPSLGPLHPPKGAEALAPALAEVMLAQCTYEGALAIDPLEHVAPIVAEEGVAVRVRNRIAEEADGKRLRPLLLVDEVREVAVGQLLGGVLDHEVLGDQLELMREGLAGAG